MRTTLATLSLSLTIALAASGEKSAPANLRITSAAFREGAMIPDRFTCKGADHNPPLHFEGIPKNAKSLVLIVDDPDAPGGLFSHWLLWNISPTAMEVSEHTVPTGAIEGTNDFGKIGYDGPCPPSGTHRYLFRLVALDRKLDLAPGAKRAALERAVQSHVLARGELMARGSH
ncbi:MAG TPA: YbhB/YbcL family Raf kinase inhibitor-like protein [Chthoniobacterales bacterium]